MARDGLSVEYENGVADVLSYLAGENATVERDVHMDGHDSHTSRQLDVVVRGTIWGLTDAVMVVDCKRWDTKIDVADAGAFAALVSDVRADFGLLVTAEGHSRAAATTLSSQRGMRIDVMSLDELTAWQPPGTRDVVYRVPADRVRDASAALRRAGFRVRLASDGRTAEDQVALCGYRHYPRNPESAPDLYGPMGAALESIGVEPEVLSSGVTTLGGTPNHRSLVVTIDGVATGLKIIAADEDEIVDQLQAAKDLAVAQGLDPRLHVFDVERPEGWPSPQRMFG